MYNDDHITEAYAETANDCAILGMQDYLETFDEEIQQLADYAAFASIDELGIEDNEYNRVFYAVRAAEQIKKEGIENYA